MFFVARIVVFSGTQNISKLHKKKKKKKNKMVESHDVDTYTKIMHCIVLW